MRYRVALCVAFPLALHSALAGAEMFGVAATDGQVVCLATRQPVPPLPRRVKVVLPHGPQRVLSGTVTDRTVTSCGALASRQLAGPFWVLRLDPGSELHPGELGIASLGRPRAAGFRSCASAEGVHLTVWSGRPLRSRRIWHAYVPLGHDVEPSCTPRDVEGTR